MRKDNIILTSSGFNDEKNYVSDSSKDLFRDTCSGKKVMILANAAPEGTGNFVARENVKNNFLSVGADEVDIIDLSEDNISTILDYDVIYGLGGDPSLLIRLNQNPAFKQNLVKFLENGVYIGESAGSMIMCDDLKWVYAVKRGTKPKYDIELDSYAGLGLTSYKIFPHWNKVSDDVRLKVEKYEKETGIEITNLDDGEFIISSYPEHE